MSFLQLYLLLKEEIEMEFDAFNISPVLDNIDIFIFEIHDNVSFQFAFLMTTILRLSKFVICWQMLHSRSIICLLLFICQLELLLEILKFCC